MFETKYKESNSALPMTSDVGSLINSLPIAKHLNGGELSKSRSNFRPGEKGLYNIIRLAIFGGLGYLTWVYILPPLFMALGKFAAVAGVGIAIVGLVVAAPAIFRWIKKFTRFLHKAAIKHDPFEELEKQKILMVRDQTSAREAHGRIKSLEREMKIEADHNEKQAETLQTKILTNQQKATRIKKEMNDLIAKLGQEAKGTDEYVYLNADLLKLLSSSERVRAQYEQAQNFVRKYGTRANIMKKASHRLTIVETVMDNKVEDFKATIDILQKDYEFASKSRNATDAAKRAMHFDKSWQLNYALDVVTTNIAEDIAATSGNFKDIETLTMNFNMDSDEMFASLDKLATDIEKGINTIPSAKEYSKPDYRLTHEDELNSGGFEKIF